MEQKNGMKIKPELEQFQFDAAQAEENVGAGHPQSILLHCPTSFLLNCNLHSLFNKYKIEIYPIFVS